jgi:anti-anti-sigma factor
MVPAARAASEVVAPLARRGVVGMSDSRYRLNHQGDVHTIELTLPIVVDPVEFDRLNEGIGRVVETASTERWVLDLSGVQYVGSALLGLLVNLRQRIKSAGGKLVLCGLSEQVNKALRTCSLHTLFNVAGARGEAEKMVRTLR